MVVDNLCNASAVVFDRVAQIVGDDAIQNLTFVRADVADRDALETIFEEFEPTSVIHFAGLKAVGESVAMPLEYYDNNLFSTVRLCEAMRDEIGRSAARCEVLPGLTLPVPDAAGQAASLLLHMLQHFLRAGFGLKLLCDWTAFWNALPPETDMARYERFVDAAGMRGFADMVGGVCAAWLGLRPEKLKLSRSFDADTLRAFLREVFDAQEFGRSSSRRMVMVRGGPIGYVREFHHQTRLNFPRAGRCPLLWPALWCATLARFLRNNRTVRGTTLGAVLAETQRRSRLMEPLALFQRGKDNDSAS